MKRQIFVVILSFIEFVLSTNSSEDITMEIANVSKGISSDLILQENQDPLWFQNENNKTVLMSNLHKKYVPVPELPGKVTKLPQKVIRLRPRVLKMKIGIEVFSEERGSNSSIFPSNITIEPPLAILQEMGILEEVRNCAKPNTISVVVFLFCIFNVFYKFTLH